jgi:hydroxymethylglutaryl-CoA reductase
MPIAARISALHQRGLLSGDDVQLLSSGNHQVQLNVADKMIENVVGVFGLPMGVALNF